MRSLEGYLLVLCWVVVLSSRQGQAFTQRSAIGLSTGRARVVNVNVNLNRSDGSSSVHEREPVGHQRRSSSSLGMVGQVYDHPDMTETLTPLRVLVPPPELSLSPLEVWCLVKIEKLYSKALNRKCPFFRRRMTDFMDTLEMMVRIAIIRQEKMDLVGPPVSLRGDARTRHKIQHLPLSQVADIIRRDWKEDSQKGYYITGLLTPAIYRDDCFFEGPDPDMPVRGLRKFLNAASQLFDPKQSRCELLSLEIEGDVIVAQWTMNGVLKLPWRPKLPEVNGRTVYNFDDNGLIYRHEETWDLTAVEAFLKTAWFDFQFKTANTYNGDLQEDLQEI
jgi:hypothetical protein